jgi:hypothetical protein
MPWSRLAAIGLGAALLAALVVGSGVAGAGGRVIRLHPPGADSSCDEELVRVARSLQAGDELVLHGGTYSQSCQRRIRDIHGTAERPIVIRAATGEVAVLTRPRDGDGTYSQNNVEVENASYVIIRGLKLKGGSTGLRFMGATHHITIEDNEIYDTDNNAVAMNSGDTDSFVIRRNHIHHTGLLPGDGVTEGEGLYVGCHDGRCVGSNHLIEHNYIHHLRGTSNGGNDGIEIKRGSYGVVVRHNVIHTTTIGTRYPCIFVYGGGPKPNLVEGNAVWECGEAIQVGSDAIIRNNVIASSDVGIVGGPHRQVPALQRVTIANNTIYGARECLYLRWQGAREMTLANNALYCPGGRAVDARGLEGAGTVRVRANLVEGTLTGAALDGVRFLAGGPARLAFREPAELDFWPRPGGPLIGAAAAEVATELDFNGNRRTPPYDVGAYQSDGKATNAGWRIAPGFKSR